MTNPTCLLIYRKAYDYLTHPNNNKINIRLIYSALHHTYIIKYLKKRL
jgi:hypothetical protein